MADKTKLSIALVVTLCIAVATSVWAITGEIDNYRLTSFTTRLDTHEDNILANMMTINTLVTNSVNEQRDMAEIKDLLKDHIAE